MKTFFVYLGMEKAGIQLQLVTWKQPGVPNFKLKSTYSMLVSKLNFLNVDAKRRPGLNAFIYYKSKVRVAYRLF